MPGGARALQCAYKGKILGVWVRELTSSVYANVRPAIVLRDTGSCLLGRRWKERGLLASLSVLG